MVNFTNSWYVFCELYKKLCNSSSIQSLCELQTATSPIESRNSTSALAFEDSSFHWPGLSKSLKMVSWSANGILNKMQRQENRLEQCTILQNSHIIRTRDRGIEAWFRNAKLDVLVSLRKMVILSFIISIFSHSNSLFIRFLPLCLPLVPEDIHSFGNKSTTFSFQVTMSTTISSRSCPPASMATSASTQLPISIRSHSWWVVNTFRAFCKVRISVRRILSAPARF